ncbi:MAG: Trk system potassium transporter TrkA [Bacteroidales bacterium]|nr:Trk system potassium transporter TrkA [Bacteroidales bacterium]MBD5218494.1 Trk system potassium transporter TrkA [Bacteroidales bacterium]MBD5222303.1 Trk system potassium transporter TrkA [Bacteroidales bacterium]
MKIIIAGAGEVGTHLAKMLSNEDQDIILLDSDQARLDVIDANYNLMTWNGSTSSFDAMKSVDVEHADLYIAVTPFETRNITSCAIAKQLGAKRTVARIDNFEFLKEENKKVLTNLGVDVLIYPENVGATEIDTALDHNWARYWGALADDNLLLIGIKLHDNSPLINVKLKDLPVTTHDFHVCAIKRKSETIIPNGNDEIRADDIVYFITTPEYVEEVRDLCGKRKRSIRKVLIMGGSRIAVRFALQYHDKYHIKIIEMNRERCEELATRLPDCEIVHGDGRDIEVLRENIIYQYDAFLALTDSSETNILSCLTAKEFGVPKTIADVENLQFISQAENLNIGTTINKKLLASSHIFQILLDSDRSNTKCMVLADAEVAEIEVKPKAKITKSPVKNLKLPYGMTLAGLIRGGEASLVDGNTHLLPGDYVVVFCLAGNIHKIEKWFS